MKIFWFENRLIKLFNPIATRSENPIDEMYKILSAMTKPSFMIPVAGKKGTTISVNAIRIFLEC